MLKQGGGKKRPFTVEEVMRWLTLLPLMDDEFLEVCFRGNNRGVELLRVILDKDDLVVRRVTVQKTLPNLYGRTVRLDIYAEDGQGKLYDIEVQVGGKLADLIARARAYSAMLDAGQRVRAMNYRHLRETWVIFITDRDLFGLGLPLYRIERQIQGTDLLFGDGAHIVFVNGAYRAPARPWAVCCTIWPVRTRTGCSTRFWPTRFGASNRTRKEYEKWARYSRNSVKR